MPPFVSRSFGGAAGGLDMNCFSFCFLWLEERADLSAGFDDAAGLFRSFWTCLLVIGGSSAVDLRDGLSSSLILESLAHVALVDSPFSSLAAESSLLATSAFGAGDGTGAGRMACCI